MKKIKFALFSLLAVAMVACGDPELPFETFEETAKGAFARRLTLGGAFTFGQVATSSFDGSVEFYSEDQGANVASYDWTVEYTGVAGDRAAVTFLQIPRSQFGTNADTGLPMATFSLGFSDALAALGLTEADVTGGDRFRFRATITLDDGSQFSESNSDSNIISSAAFGALFRVDANVVCVSDIEGTFNFVTTDLVRGDGAACDNAGDATGTVTWTHQGDGVYTTTDLSFGQFAHCWSDAPALASSSRVLDVCDAISTDGADQYGDTYTYNVTAVNGASATIEWTNSFGDGGTATLTRTDGNNWPAGLN